MHKGRLATADIIAVDYDGKALAEGQKPSAETLLHCQLYRLFPPVGAVLHGHSVAATVLSMRGAITFSNYELLKAFGYATHELDVVLPVYENDQDMVRLAALSSPCWSAIRRSAMSLPAMACMPGAPPWNTPTGGWRLWNFCSNASWSGDNCHDTSDRL